MLSVFHRSDEEIRREITQDVIADGFFTDPARLTVTVRNGIVTLEGEPGSAVLGAGIAGRVSTSRAWSPSGTALSTRPVRPIHSLPTRDFSPGPHGPNALAAGDGPRS